MCERWAPEFELRARALWTDDAVRQVTEGKNLPILPSTAPTLLRALGLLHRDATMPPPQVRKFLQLNHMIRLLRPPLLELIERGEPLRIVDAGCGLSYLTLSLAWCFRHVFRHPATLIGIDRDEARVEACRATTAQLGLGELLTFRAGSIEGFEPDGKLHAVLSLHACDTATDDAIALGLRHGAGLIAVAPCCQAELARAWADLATSRTGPLQPLWSTPHLRREAAATITDTMRTLLLRAAGYETRVVEFVPSQHTPKNTLIRAMRRGGRDEEAVTQYVELRDATGGAGISLARAMGIARPTDAVRPSDD
ncbi:MAG: SAM-dependent methyltransferase [Planctomycetota bacterium]